jgi:hypothetical protein
MSAGTLPLNSKVFRVFSSPSPPQIIIHYHVVIRQNLTYCERH